MSYAIAPFASRGRAFHGMGMGAYNQAAVPVFDGCTMNLTTGRTTWPPFWACNQSNFVAALDANKAMLPANASQTDINLHLMSYFNDVIAGKIPGPPGFPSKDTPQPTTEALPAPPGPTPPGPTQPSLVAPPPTSSSSTVKYAIAGVGLLAVIGVVLAKRKRG
jgi:LPXTG-motif cell wall-anchored protein